MFLTFLKLDIEFIWRKVFIISRGFDSTSIDKHKTNYIYNKDKLSMGAIIWQTGQEKDRNTIYKQTFRQKKC